MTRHRSGRAPSQRQLRMGEELRHALATALAEHRLADPALHDVSITVTEVRLSPDMRNATAFVVPLGGAATDQIVSALRRARGYFRGRVGGMVEMRYVPEIRFEADRSFDTAARVEALLREDPPAPPDEATEGPAGEAAPDDGPQRREDDRG